MEAPALLSDIAVADFAKEAGAAPFALRMLLKFAKKSNDLARRKDGSINRRLADLSEYKLPANETPRNGVCSKDVTIDTETGVWARVFWPCSEKGKQPQPQPQPETPTPKGGMPVIFYFHGGGFAVLCANFFLYDIFCRRLCKRCQAVVISVNYRRAPEHPHPIPYDDSFNALQWLEAAAGEDQRSGAWPFEKLEVDVSRCILMGDSAGANIVHHVGCRWLERGGGGELRVAAHVLLCPFWGGEERTEAEVRLGSGGRAPLVSTENTDWYWKAFLPAGSDRDHPCCNVFGPRAPELGPLALPPSLVAIAEFDPLKDWQRRYVSGLQAAAKPVRLLYYKGAVHSCHLFNSTNVSSLILADIKAFVAEVLAS